MKKFILEKIKESLHNILPITIIILILSIIVGISFKEITVFLVSAILLIIGLILFSLGASSSMMMIAEAIGRFLTRKRSLKLIIFTSFIIGFLITVAEPSLWVLGDQFQAVPSSILILSVAIGIGIFLVLALLRIIFQIKLSLIILISYLLIFIFVLFVPNEFIPVAFDSGGVTTGPMAVPFIIALGLGISSERLDVTSEEDTFGLIGISSIGPIIAVFILGLFVKPAYANSSINLSTIDYLIKYLLELFIAIIPFMLFFVVFQLFAIKLSKRKVIKIMIGLLFTYLGLVLFLTGASTGFITIGTKLGESLGALKYNWILIPLGMIFGFTIVSAEPAVVVLNKQVEEVTSGVVSKKLMQYAMSIGVSIAIGLACLRIITGINILWILIPGYLIALVLTFFVPKMFTGIAFDSGGAVSGAMTSTFLMPFALGSSSVIDGSNILTDAFGLIAFVALAPLITIQMVGYIYKIKTQEKVKDVKFDDEIINLSEV